MLSLDLSESTRGAPDEVEKKMQTPRPGPPPPTRKSRIDSWVLILLPGDPSLVLLPSPLLADAEIRFGFSFSFSFTFYHIHGSMGGEQVIQEKPSVTDGLACIPCVSFFYVLFFFIFKLV